MRSTYFTKFVLTASWLYAAFVVPVASASRPNYYSGLDPAARAFLEKINAQGGRPIYELPPAEARRVLRELTAGHIGKPAAQIEDRVINTDAGDVGVRIVRPADSTRLLPVIVYIHGGGWVLGDELTHDHLVRKLSNLSGAAIVFVKYSRSPEVNYPVALNQSYSVAVWLEKHGHSLRLDGSRLAIAGDSVGGNMATVLTLMAKQRGGPKFRYQVLLYPVTDLSTEWDSYRRFGTGYYLTEKAMEWFRDSYAPDSAVWKEPNLSPVRASTEQLRGLPPATIITNEFDVLRDQGEAYAHKLLDAGVPVIGERAFGMIHDSAILDAVVDTPVVQAMIGRAALSLHDALAK